MHWKRVFLFTVLLTHCSSFLVYGEGEKGLGLGDVEEVIRTEEGTLVVEEGIAASDKVGILDLEVDKEPSLSSMVHNKPTRSTLPQELPSCNNDKKRRRKQQRQAFEHGVLNEEEMQILPAPNGSPRKGGGTSNESSERHFLVTTLDGKLTLLNEKGREVWQIHTGELFSSTISSLQLNENGKWVNLIPSLTGGLYRYDEESLLPMPMNVDTLLHKSFKLSNDVVINGGKELRTLGIDLKTGRVRYDCGIGGCVNPHSNELVEENTGGEEPVTLVVKKQLQTVRAVDTQSGTEKWNFSVGMHEMGLTGVKKGCLQEEEEEETKESFKKLDVVKFIIPEGRLLLADPDTKTVLDKKFGSPIAQAWVLEDGHLTYIDPVQNTPIKEGPLLYVGSHNQQFYVQESRQLTHRLEKLMGYQTYKNVNEDKPPKIAWKPSYLLSDESSESMTALSPVTPLGPIIRPFFVLQQDEIISETDETSIHQIDTDQESTTSPPTLEGEGSSYFGFDFEDVDLDGPIQIVQEVIIGSLWVWWKEVLGISLFTAVILNILLMRPIVRATRIRAVQDVLRYLRDLANGEQQGQVIERQNLLPIMDASGGLSISVESQSQPETSSTLSRPRTLSLNNSSNEGGGMVEFIDQELLYSSQYLREFEPIQCLGRGGFGVVFEAKKRIDDRNYAVKRIALPNREEARVRVMREVKALAQLDHKNIVRYFNAWIEHPPNGWLERNDPLWAAPQIGSMSPTAEDPLSGFPTTASESCQEESRRVLNRRKRKTTLMPGGDHDLSLPLLEEENSSYIIFQEHSRSNPIGSRSDGDGYDSASEFSKSRRVPDVSSEGGSSAGGFWKKPAEESVSWNLTSENNNPLDGDSIDLSICKKNSNPLMAIYSDANKEDGLEVGEEAKESENTVSVMFLYIQQELCQKRTLREWLRAEKTRDLRLVINFFSQIVDAVEYVHSKKLIHRDLKPSNVFLAGNSDEEEHVVKIGDFGLATNLLDANVSPSDENETKKSNNLTSQVGTQLYMSPEQFKSKLYDYKVDIYSLGLIFFELLIPFDTEMERLEILGQVRKARIPPSFVEAYPEEHSMIVKMISHNPALRPDATSISQWVKDHLRTLETSQHPGGTHRSNSSPGKISLSRWGSAGSDPSTSKLHLFPDKPVAAGSAPNKFHKSHSFTSI